METGTELKEKKVRSKLLLISFIWSITVFVLFSIMHIYTMVTVANMWGRVNVFSILLPFVLFLVFLFPTIVLNIFAWLKNNYKLAFIAAFLYLISNPISSVLCFIGFAIHKYQKQQKKCPFCAKNIKQDAVVCRFCHRDYPN